MRFVGPRPFANPDLGARKLVEIANGIEAVQDGRIYIELVNAPFLAAGGSGHDFRAGIARAIAQGLLVTQETQQIDNAYDSCHRSAKEKQAHLSVEGFGVAGRSIVRWTRYEKCHCLIL